jgi:glycine cleavage system protein P-like pyridoxal-binding family
MHDLSCFSWQIKEYGVSTLDMQKDCWISFHAPTVYFPLIVREAMLIDLLKRKSKDSRMLCQCNDRNCAGM